MTIVVKLLELSVKIRTGTLDFDLLRPYPQSSVFFSLRSRIKSRQYSLVWSMLGYYGYKLGLVLTSGF